MSEQSDCLTTEWNETCNESNDNRVLITLPCNLIVVLQIQINQVSLNSSAQILVTFGYRRRNRPNSFVAFISYSTRTRTRSRSVI